MMHFTKEYHSLIQCLYCNENMQNHRWVSQHIDQIHYKTAKCDCGKINSIKVNNNFLSSGHDNWDKKNWLSIKDLNKIKKNLNLEKKIIF